MKTPAVMNSAYGLGMLYGLSGKCMESIQSSARHIVNPI